MDISSTICFRNICELLEKLKKAKDVTAKQKVVRKFYDMFAQHRATFRQEQNMIVGEEETGRSSFYSILRCIIPGADSRPSYGLQITALSKIFIKVLQLPGDSRDAERLHARTRSGIHGDYAEVVFSVLSPRCQRPPSNLKLSEIHEMLDSIAEDDRRNTEKVLTRLTEIASPNEQKWFIRLLLKTMHVGIAEQRVLSALHPQASELYKRCSNLSRVCCLLADNKLTVDATDATGSTLSGQKQLNLVEAIVPFQHIRPMLCEIFPGDITPIMAADMLYMETKMDGERFQVHFANERFKYISRNGHDYTYAFGENYQTGKLTPKLQNLLPIGMESIILDGEMMVWDETRKNFRPKGENTDVKHLSSQRDWTPCFVVYDLLYLNGSSLLELPYVQRKYKLSMNVKEQPGVLQLMQPKRVKDIDDFKNLFQQALDADEEGVVLKKETSVYRPGQRNGGGWYKIKADYIEGLTTEFDLLVIGGFYNRQRTFIDAFLMGVLKYISPTQYEVYSVGKVTNNSRQRVVLCDTLKPHWHQVATEPPPSWYHYKEKSADGRPDVWIDPKLSIILQVKAADLAPSGAFVLSKSLHFARMDAWRNDKLWNECMLISEYIELIKGKRGIRKINKRELTLEDFTTHRKRLKLTPAERRKLAIEVYDKKLDPKNVENVSDFLNGFSFCLLSDAPQNGYTMAELKRLVVCNGGEIIENPMYHNPKCIVLAGNITYRVETIQKKKGSIVKMDWMVRTCDTKEWRLTPRDMICTDDELAKEFAERFDKYGDSFTDMNELRELKEILDDMPDDEVDAIELTEAKMKELEAELFKSNSPYFFRTKCAGFYKDDARSRLAEILFKYRGGCVKELQFDENTSVAIELDYVFVNLEGLKKDALKAWHIQHFKQQKPELVNITWAIHSHNAKKLLNMQEYSCEDLLLAGS